MRLIKLTLIKGLVFSSVAMAEEKKINLYENKYECEFEFELGKSDISEEKLKECASQVPNIDKLKYVQIIASSNLVGDFEYNKKLSDRRIKTVRNYLNNYFKHDIIAKEISVGKNSSLDKKAYVVIVTESTQMKKPRVYAKKIESNDILSTQIKDSATPNAKENSANQIDDASSKATKENNSKISYFLGTRLGRDIYMHDQIEPYFSYGIIGGITYQKYQNIKFELGATINQMENSKVLSITNSYGLAGIYLTSNEETGFFFGLRGLGGAVINENGESAIDLGGETRIGYENSIFSAGFGLGRTQFMTRAGAEFSLKI